MKEQQKLKKDLELGWNKRESNTTKLKSTSNIWRRRE
jgi:hypothetical protein